MPRRAPLAASFLIRWALLLVLAVGTCVQPVLAAACEAGDAGAAFAAAAGQPAVDADAGAGGDDCCDGQACGDCCLHATASLQPPPAVAAALPRAAPAVAPAPRRPAHDAPVEIRPPIRG